MREPHQCIVVVRIDRKDPLEQLRRGGPISMLFVPQRKVVKRGNPVRIERERLPERLARLVVAMQLGEDHRDIGPDLLGSFNTEPERCLVRGERFLQATQATQIAGQIEMRDRQIRAHRRQAATNLHGPLYPAELLAGGGQRQVMPGLQRGKLDQACEHLRRRRRPARRAIEIHQRVEHEAVVRVGFEHVQQLSLRVRELADGNQRPCARNGASAFRHEKHRCWNFRWCGICIVPRLCARASPAS